MTAGTMPVPPTSGGAVEHLVYGLVRENELADLPFDFTVFSIAPRLGQEYQTAFNHTNWHWVARTSLHRLVDRFLGRRLLGRLSPRFKNYPFFLHSLSKLSADSHDLVVFNNRPDILQHCAPRLQCPLALHLHNEYLSFPREEMQQAVHQAAGVLAVSGFIARQVREAFPEQRAKIHPVHNGIDASLFDPSRWTGARERVRAKLGLHRDDLVLLYSGRLVPAKGADRLLKAVALLGDRTQIKVMVVGATGYDEDHPTDFSRSVRDCAVQLGDRVVFTGYVRYEEMPQYYCAADIAVLPFIFEEPFGLTVIESMSMELPVITTDSGGVPELVGAGGMILTRADLEAKLAAAIRRLHDDPAARKAMGAIGRATVLESFTYRHFYERFARSAKNLLAQCQPGC
jgi:glycosyltransferase involved in cell wall biosynthesis